MQKLETPTAVSSKQQQKKIKRLGRINAIGIIDVVIGLALFVTIWQLVYWAKIWPSFLFPSPAQVLTRFVAMANNGSLLQGTATTMERLVAGFAVSIGIGIAVGLAMVTFKRFGRAMSSFCVGLQSFPSIAWVPFAILLFGLNDYGIIFVTVISSTFSVMLSTYSGIRNIPPIFLKASKNMGSKGLSLFRHVMLPASLPQLITGIRQAWSFAWHAVIGAEILMATMGLGAILEFGANFARMDQIEAAMITIFSIGLVADRVLFYKLEDRVRSKWGFDKGIPP